MPDRKFSRKYHIGIRLHGEAKEYIRSLANQLNLEFKDEETEKRIVPHVTLLRPFLCYSENKLISLFNETLSKTPLPIYLQFQGFGVFRNRPSVFYADIEQNGRVDELARSLETNLNEIIAYANPQISSSKDMTRKFHATIISGDDEGLERRINELVRKKGFKPINHPVVRVYLLQHPEKIILREYDFYQRRSLTRQEALDSNLFLKTLKAYEGTLVN